MLDQVRARLEGVRDRIRHAARRAGRDPASIRIVAVSKTFPADSVRAAAAAGQTDFGENKVQEALQKIAGTADLGLRWHLIGHLQSNKAKKAAARFDVIHSIDNVMLVEKVDQGAQEAGRSVDFIIQIDLAGETTKYGATPEEVPAIVSAAERCRAARLRGLMLLPPAMDDPQEARAYFAALRQLSLDLQAKGADPSMLSELSMGMSHDFEVAVEEGATIVRIGTAIFGSRPIVEPVRDR